MNDGWRPLDSHASNDGLFVDRLDVIGPDESSVRVGS